MEVEVEFPATSSHLMSLLVSSPPKSLLDPSSDPSSVPFNVACRSMLLVFSLSGKLMLLASCLPIPSGSCPMSLLRSVLPLLGVSKDSITLNAASIVVCLLEVLLALPLTLLVALLVALPLTLLVALLVALLVTLLELVALLNWDGSLIEMKVIETRGPCLVGRWSSNA